jgi:catechol 2,3-dioxygenase-like lactoylglutathione lyase family enzyme
MTTNKAYVEHVAVRVKDIQWHIRFFRDVLGMEMREMAGPPESPSQYWTLGGLQFMSTPDFAAPPSTTSGWLGHLGIMVQDLELALSEAQAWGVKELHQGRNWLQLPDGLAIELIQSHGDGVAQALAVKSRP